MVVFLNGGLGKSIAFTALLPDVVKKYGELVVVSGHPEVFEGMPGVKYSLDGSTAYGYEHYVKGHDIMWPEPYQTQNYFSKKKNLIAAYCEVCGIEYRSDMHPMCPPKIASAPVQPIGPYIVTQFTGGGSPFMQQPKPPFGQARDYLHGQEVIMLLKQNRPNIKVINFALPWEPHYQGEEQIQGPLPFPIMWTLLRDATAFVAIDSSLHHMAAAFKKKGVVLWGGTDPKLLGYVEQTNILGECPLNDPQCMRPWTMPVLDNLAQGRPWDCASKECQNIKPEKVYAELEKLLGK